MIMPETTTTTQAVFFDSLVLQNFSRALSSGAVRADDVLGLDLTCLMDLPLIVPLASSSGKFEVWKAED